MVFKHAPDVFHAGDQKTGMSGRWPSRNNAVGPCWWRSVRRAEGTDLPRRVARNSGTNSIEEDEEFPGKTGAFAVISSGGKFPPLFSPCVAGAVVERGSWRRTSGRDSPASWLPQPSTPSLAESASLKMGYFSETRAMALFFGDDLARGLPPPRVQ